MSEEVLIWTIFIFGVAVVEVAINELLEAQLAVAVCIHSQECVLCPRRLRHSEMVKQSLVFFLLKVAVRVGFHQVEKQRIILLRVSSVPGRNAASSQVK